MDDSAAALLGADGPLAASIPQFTPRLPQQEMADAVEQALRHDEALVVEAGTGTGKTYAYLVPALMSGRRVAISTGTKTLQDQLFHRDLPRVRDALGIPTRVALLKGRGNYLCLYRMKRARLVPALKVPLSAPARGGGLGAAHADRRDFRTWQPGRRGGAGAPDHLHCRQLPGQPLPGFRWLPCGARSAQRPRRPMWW